MVDIRDCLVWLMVVGFPSGAHFQISAECPYTQLSTNIDATSGQIETAFAALANSEPAIQTSQNNGNVRSSFPTGRYPGNTMLSWLQNYFKINDISDGTAEPTQTISHSASDMTQNYFEVHSSEKLQCSVPPKNCANDTRNIYYRSLDGSCNNLQYSEFGMANSRFSRLLPPNYSDSVDLPTKSHTGRPLPNARLLSLSIFGDETTPDSFRTMANMQWGQFVAHDIANFAKQDAPKDCCANSGHKMCYPITLQSQDPISYNGQKKCLHFVRGTTDVDINCPKSGLTYAEKISKATAYLDLSFLYGISEEENRNIRKGVGGLLKTSLWNNRHWLPISMNNNGECGEDNYQCFKIPDMRNQFIPSGTVMHTVMLREHNRIANSLAKMNPYYSDETIFQEARKISIAQYQYITYYHWLPLIIGHKYAHAYNLIHYSYNDAYVYDYNQTVNPAPYAEFAAAAFRYLHNQVPGWFSMVTSDRVGNHTMRLSDYFDRPETVNMMAHGENFDALIRGLATEEQKRSDTNIDREIKHFFDRKLFEKFGSDLKAIDIQRGRDFGLASYNDVRAHCGLPRAYDWSGFSREISADKIVLMQQLYESPHDVELTVGASSETHLHDTILGPTFLCIIAQQFLQTRIGDRFFFEREDNYSGFSHEQLKEIRKASPSGLFCRNADFLQKMQPNAFLTPNIRNCIKSCDDIPQVDLTKWSSVKMP